jgi:hypothetical protein
MKKKMTKQGVEKEQERISIQAVLTTQTMQRCASKLAKRSKEDRGGEREREEKKYTKE